MPSSAHLTLFIVTFLCQYHIHPHTLVKYAYQRVMWRVCTQDEPGTICVTGNNQMNLYESVRRQQRQSGGHQNQVERVKNKNGHADYLDFMSVVLFLAVCVWAWFGISHLSSSLACRVWPGTIVNFCILQCARQCARQTHTFARHVTLVHSYMFDTASWSLCLKIDARA